MPLPSLRPPALEIRREVPAQPGTKTNNLDLPCSFSPKSGRIKDHPALSVSGPSQSPHETWPPPTTQRDRVQSWSRQRRIRREKICQVDAARARLPPLGLCRLPAAIEALLPCYCAHWRLRPLDLPASRHFRVPRISATSVAVAPVLSRTPAVCASKAVCGAAVSGSGIGTRQAASARQPQRQDRWPWMSQYFGDGPNFKPGGCVRAHLSFLA